MWLKHHIVFCPDKKLGKMPENSKEKNLAINSPFLLFTQIVDYNAQRVSNSLQEKIRNLKNHIVNFNMEPVKKIKKLLSGKNLIIVAVIVLVIALGAWFFTRSKSNSTSANSEETFVSSGGPTAPLNKKIAFPIRDNNGKTTGTNLTVNFTNLERTSKVIYNGRPLIARESKDFIVANMEIENTTKDRLTVRPVDFIRLVDASGKNYAADFQTSAIKVEPLSTKRTRTIFIVDESQKNLKFLIGEINGNREPVEVTI